MGGRSFIHHIAVLGVIALSLPALSAAQRGGGIAAGGFGGHAGGGIGHAAPASHFVAAGARGVSRAPVARPGVARAVGSGRARTGTTGRTRSSSFNRNFSPDFGETNFNDVPGLGFDFPHLAAISGGRRHHEGFFGGFPFFDSGLLFGGPSVIVEQAPPAEAPPEASDAIAGDASEPARRPSRTWYSYQAPEPAAAQNAPQDDAEQYVFVRRDGSLLFGVAYSWDNGTLRYVTSDGIRRSIGSDALDLSATEQFNEQRGLNFHAPA